jgi:hypothetical protein
MTTKTLYGVYDAAYNLKSPITTLRITTPAYLGGGVVAAGVNTYSIINYGHVKADKYGVSLAGKGVITNVGTIRSTNTAAGAGVVISGGTVTNAGGVIAGYDGVVMIGNPGTVSNANTIAGYGKYGVGLVDGGVVINGSTLVKGAVIEAPVAIFAGNAATVHNFGSVLGSGSAGVGGYLKAGGTLTNGAANDLTAVVAGTAIGFIISGATGQVTNFGTIRANGTDSVGLALLGGGLINNGSNTDTTALIEGTYQGVETLGHAATVNNFGTVAAAYNFSSIHAGVYLAGGGVVTNGSSADATALLRGPVGAIITKAFGTVRNFATIGGDFTLIGAAVTGGGLIVNGSNSDTTALVRAAIGVAAATLPATIENFGTIVGTALTTISAGVDLAGGGLVTNGSATDTKALIEGKFGIYTGTIAATGINYAKIVGSLDGVIMQGGGKFTNGLTSDTTAVTQGGAAGVEMTITAGNVNNFATILGGLVGGVGVSMAASGTVTNGGATDSAAYIYAASGVVMDVQSSLVNWATIRGGYNASNDGVLLTYKGTLTNKAGALIAGYAGVYADKYGVINNFGSIEALGGSGVVLNDVTARLNAEAGSSINGVVVAGGGEVDAVGGVASFTALSSGGLVTGAGTVALNGGASSLLTGVKLNVAEVTLGGAATTVEVFTTLTDSKVWDQTAGTLKVDAGDTMSFTGTGDSFSGQVSGKGAFVLGGGSDTLTNVTLEAATMKISTATVVLNGSVTISGTLSATTPNLIVAAGGASLDGGTLLLTNNVTNSLRGASGTATLTNVSSILRGGGALGAGKLTLVNDAGGVIESGVAAPLTINTGATKITNAGQINALSGGGLTIASAVNNTGTLGAINGLLTVNGAVTGAGTVRIASGGEAVFNSTFNEAVTFVASGQLVLAQSTGYTASITGFSTTTSTSLDLKDIAFATATTSYSGTTSAGILTVTDGTNTAKIHLTGNYTASTWNIANDGSGGTKVTDPVHPVTAAIIAQSAAGLGHAPPGVASLASESWKTGPPLLLVPRVQIA